MLWIAYGLTLLVKRPQDKPGGNVNILFNNDERGDQSALRLVYWIFCYNLHMNGNCNLLDVGGHRVEVLCSTNRLCMNKILFAHFNYNEHNRKVR